MKKITYFILCILICFLLSSCGQTSVKSTGSAERPETSAEKKPLSAPVRTGAAVAPKETRVHIAAAGDNIPHESVIETGASDASAGQNYDFSKIYEGVRPLISEADIAFVNQESPVGGEALGISGYPDFNAPHEIVEALIDTGFDVFNIANNHMLDKGETGYINTVQYFNTLPVTMIGGYTKQDYDAIRMVEHSGMRIAFLAYTTLVNGSHANDLSDSSGYLIPYADPEVITRQVRLAKEKADAVIVSFHWGTEEESGITEEQQTYASLCADLGVDVVLGHHPHVAGQTAYLTGQNGNRTLVAYSLGNFCSTQLYSQNLVGEILTFDLVKDAKGTISVENALVHPVISHYKTDVTQKDSLGLAVRYDLRLYLMENYTEELAREHGANNWGAFSLDILKKHITDHTDAEFLPDSLRP